jgi:hypothetical protein
MRVCLPAQHLPVVAHIDSEVLGLQPLLEARHIGVKRSLVTRQSKATRSNVGRWSVTNSSPALTRGHDDGGESAIPVYSVENIGRNGIDAVTPSLIVWRTESASAPVTQSGAEPK